jgi:hypothetical protein
MLAPGVLTVASTVAAASVSIPSRPRVVPGGVVRFFMVEFPSWAGMNDWVLTDRNGLVTAWGGHGAR